jgi:hypothetical protein
VHTSFVSPTTALALSLSNDPSGWRFSLYIKCIRKGFFLNASGESAQDIIEEALKGKKVDDGEEILSQGFSSYSFTPFPKDKQDANRLASSWLYPSLT